MVSAIGSSAFSSSASPAGGGISSAGLEAQLERYQKELSSCVNCSSASTSEGKEKIQSLVSKISELRSRIQEIVNAKSNAQPVALNVKTPDSVTADKALASKTQYNTDVATVPATGSPTATVGNRLNVFA